LYKEERRGLSSVCMRGEEEEMMQKRERERIKQKGDGDK
jgi:hypothetical protein